jgi:hypothetical protein
VTMVCSSTTLFRDLITEDIFFIDLGDNDILVTGIDGRPLLTVRQAEDFRVGKKRKVVDKDEGFNEASGSREPVVAAKKARLIHPGQKMVKEKGKGRAVPKSLPYIVDDDAKDLSPMHTVHDSNVTGLSLPLASHAPPIHTSPMGYNFDAPLLTLPTLPQHLPPPSIHESSGPDVFFDWDQILHDIMSQKLVGQSQPAPLLRDDPNFGLLPPNNNCS